MSEPDTPQTPRDSAGPGDARPAGGSSRPGPPVRRHLMVLGVGVLGLIIGIVLVLTGRSDSPDTADPDPVSSAAPGPLLTDLGVVDDEDAARVLIGGLDPTSLEPGGEDPTTTGESTTTVDGVDLSEAGVQRCQQAVVQQNTDRSLGDRLAAARLVVEDTPALVVSYELPASGSDPAGERVVVVDARTCRVLTAVEHTG